MEREDKRGIFFGVIGVLTLIVAIIGASLAYFSINAKSKDNAVDVEAAMVQIEFQDGTLLKTTDIIPASKEVAAETVKRFLAQSQDQNDYKLCEDDNGKNVCGIYDFTLTNKGKDAITANASIIPDSALVGEEAAEIKKFTNLKYILLDTTELAPSAKDETRKLAGGIELATGSIATLTEPGTPKYDEVKMGENVITIPGTQTKTYRLFVWLDEKNDAQDYEQGAKYTGTIHISVNGSGGQISGNADKTLGGA